MGFDLLLIAAALAVPPTSQSASSTATATIRVYHSIRLNSSSELFEANAQIRTVPVIADGAIQYIPVAEFE